MAAQTWYVTVKTTLGNEKHCVFAPNPHAAQVQLERRGYVVVSVQEGLFCQNVNASAEFRNL